MPSPYQGVILAAGGGSRMGPLADHCPKALLPVANVPLIIRHVETLRALNVREILVVIGHHAALIEGTLGDGREHGVAIHYVQQHERHGLAHAVAALASHISRPFYLLLGDIYFEFTHLGVAARVFEAEGAAAVLAIERGAEPAAVRRNFSVDLEPGGRIRRVVEKPAEVDCRAKGCGFYLFDERIFEAIRQTPRSALRNEFELTDAIQVLIDTAAPVFGVEMTGWDVNITVPPDVIACNVRALQALGQRQLVGHGCTIAPGAVLEQSAVGDGARITHPIRLQRCVVLPGAVVESEADLCDAVIASGLIAR
ncbi:MAG: NTP transferase domain-containing protein [Candidatus Hydrogenedentes bacterium]|nr:NTP transferase domain-containing protein [Candidatus Hydrogenedentota bacterium]